MDYNIGGNIFYNATIEIVDFGSLNGCTIDYLISGTKGSSEIASLTATNEVPPKGRTDEEIYVWLLKQLEPYEI